MSDAVGSELHLQVQNRKLELATFSLWIQRHTTQTFEVVCACQGHLPWLDNDQNYLDFCGKDSCFSRLYILIHWGNYQIIQNVHFANT